MASEIKEILTWLLLAGSIIINNGQPIQTQLDKLAVENFREYLQIPSVHPNIDYGDCVAFIKKQAKSLGLPVKVYEVRPKKPIVVITWEGEEPEKPSILLNGHMDVVPVFPEEWIYPPFEAHMDEKGNIYARGAQDMKSVSIQYLEAIRRLKLKGIRLRRTVHISFVPDEEVDDPGMESFAKSEELKNLNIGFALDEGRATPNNEFSLHYGERTVFQIWVHCPGEPGHGSTLADNTAGEKLRAVIDRFMDFRASEKEKLKDPKLRPGDVTSVNLDLVKGGVQVNVLPNELSVGFDIRVSPRTNFDKFENMIKEWLKESGEGVHYSIMTKDTPVESTKLDESNIFWLPFKKVFNDNDMKLDPQIKAGASDARFLRALGIPAFGFSPMINTPPLLHASNEYLNKDVFLEGIDIFMKIITAVANVK